MSNMPGRIAATSPTMTAGIPGELNVRAISLWYDGAIYCQDQNAMSNSLVKQILSIVFLSPDWKRIGKSEELSILDWLTHLLSIPH